MRNSTFATSAGLALVLAFGLALRLFSQHNGFRSVVTKSLATSEGYDQKFIDLVDHLEDVLATRASFAYPGGKDPMTGRRREVAAPVSNPAPRRIASGKSASPAKKPGAAKQDSVVLPPEPPPDRVKLTAIIADDYGQHTAIVMDGERSLSVDVGDFVGNRKVSRITSKEITMEDEIAVYGYDLSGNRIFQKK